MKKIKSLIKLANLSSEHVNEKELRLVSGGVPGECHCGCFYCSCGGSSRKNNSGENTKWGFVSPLPSADTDCGICV